jgi:hypothetical protein
MSFAALERNLFLLGVLLLVLHRFFTYKQQKDIIRAKLLMPE